MRKRIFFFKRIKKQNQKGESKKNKKRETIFQDTEKTWKINVKICPTKKGNRQNRVFWEQKKTEKRQFCRSFQGFEIYKESNRYRKNKETTKEQEKFKRAEKGERTEKTRRDNK